MKPIELKKLIHSYIKAGDTVECVQDALRPELTLGKRYTVKELLLNTRLPYPTVILNEPNFEEYRYTLHRFRPTNILCYDI